MNTPYGVKMWEFERFDGDRILDWLSIQLLVISLY